MLLRWLRAPRYRYLEGISYSRQYGPRATLRRERWERWHWWAFAWMNLVVHRLHPQRRIAWLRPLTNVWCDWFEYEFETRDVEYLPRPELEQLRPELRQRLMPRVLEWQARRAVAASAPVVARSATMPLDGERMPSTLAVGGSDPR